MKREDVYFEAMRTRDHRFDGQFYVGVKTTGIYCRPICPAKPLRKNVEFFQSHLEAEKAGYRPCLRCRPESAPRSPAWIGKSAIVQRALKVLHQKEVLEFDENEFADRFGVSARHLRRLFIEEIGKTPKQLCFENRLNLARKLLSETNLKMSEVAFASGFDSIRRFNDAFKKRFHKSPSEIRKIKNVKSDGIHISLSYRPPFHFNALLDHYRSHRIGDLELFENSTYQRWIQCEQGMSLVKVSNDEVHNCLQVEIPSALIQDIHFILSRVREMFDLDSDPLVIANAIEKNVSITKIINKHPGIRVPSGWNSFEVAISIILGQLVSVEAGQRLVAGLIQICGTKIKSSDEKNEIQIFPTPQQILDADLQNLKTTKIRKQTLKNFSKAILDGFVHLDSAQDVDLFVEKVRSIAGIGPWTAQYMAMKCLRHTDAFPETDLILKRALEKHSKKQIDQMRPWRAYVAALFWREYYRTLQKSKGS